MAKLQFERGFNDVEELEEYFQAVEIDGETGVITNSNLLTYHEHLPANLSTLRGKEIIDAMEVKGWDFIL